MGWMIVLCAIAAFLVIWQKKDLNASYNRPAMVGPERVKGNILTPTHDSIHQLKTNRRKLDSQAANDVNSIEQLQNDLTAGELNAVHEKIAELSDAHQLTGVASLLKRWCREGSLEVVQWCLVLSRDSDSELHSTLCAEALSNPSEIMREVAASQLEDKVGIRFSDSAQARSWLAAKSDHR